MSSAHTITSKASTEKLSMGHDLEMQPPSQAALPTFDAPFARFTVDAQRDRVAKSQMYATSDGALKARRPSNGSVNQPRRARFVVAVAPGDEYDDDANGGLKRTLHQRQTQMIALSATIGSGLFLGSASALTTGGPLGALLAYGLVATIAYSVCISLAELTAFAPIPGGFASHAARWLDPAAGFTAGWYWFYSSVTTVPLAITACTVLLSFWTTASWTTPFFTALLLLAMIATNLMPAHAYGNLEVLFGCIKLTTVVGLCIMGFIVDLGGNPLNDRIGFRYWRDPGPMVSYLADGAAGRFVGLLACFSQASFSFQGLEVVSMAAAETRSPRRAISTAIRRAFKRVTLAYLFGLLVAGVLVPYNDDDLNNADNAGTALISPFVVAVKRVGIVALPSIINTCVLIAAFSSGSAYLFGSSRVLQGLAVRGQAPRFFVKTSARGMPLRAVLASSVFGLLAFLNVSSGSSQVFNWFYNITTQAGYIAWLCITVTFLRFCDGMRAQGLDRTRLLYHGRFQPFAAWWATCWLVFLSLTCGFTSFFSPFSATSFVTSYIGLPFALILFLGYKWKCGSHFWRAYEMDFETAIPTLSETEEAEIPPLTWYDKLLRLI